MVNTVSLLTYIMTHAFGHRDRMQLSVTYPKKAVVLKWKGVPPEAHALAVIIKDIAKKKPNYYGVLYNLPVDSHGVTLNQYAHVANKYLGKNTWGQLQVSDQLLTNHHVKVSLYALDQRFSKRELTGEKLEKVLHGHIITKTHQVIN